MTLPAGSCLPPPPLHRSRPSRGLLPTTDTVVAALAGPRHRYCPNLAAMTTLSSCCVLGTPSPLSCYRLWGVQLAGTDLQPGCRPCSNKGLGPPQPALHFITQGFRSLNYHCPLPASPLLAPPCVPLVPSGLVPPLWHVSCACASVLQPAAPCLQPLRLSRGGGLGACGPWPLGSQDAEGTQAGQHSQACYCPPKPMNVRVLQSPTPRGGRPAEPPTAHSHPLWGLLPVRV